MNPNVEGLLEIQSITSNLNDIYICSISHEERCLGSIRLTKGFSFKKTYILSYETGIANGQYLNELANRIGNEHEYEIIPAQENSYHAIAQLIESLMKLDLDPNNSTITLDVSTIDKKHLLTLLQGLDDLGLWNCLRILYSEPGDYVPNYSSSEPSGFRNIVPIPGYVHTQPLNKPVLLVLFLGYESERAVGIFNNLEPSETILIVPKPAYNPLWEGRTEKLNNYLIKLLGDNRIRYVHSKNPYSVFDELNRIFNNEKFSIDDWDCYFAPIGTKPQIIGIYMFWRQQPGKFSIITSEPIKPYGLLKSEGVGRTWLLKDIIKMRS